MGRRMFGYRGTMHDTTFRSCYGMPPFMVSKLWVELVIRGVLTCDLHRHPMTLLWTLNHLKVYPSWNVAAATAGVSVANYRKRVVEMIECMSELGLVSCFVFAVAVPFLSSVPHTCLGSLEQPCPNRTNIDGEL